LQASQDVRFEGNQRAEVYGWITRTLRQQRYREQGKKVRGLLLRYVAKMTGLSRTQVTRLVAQYKKHSEVKEAPLSAAPFRESLLVEGKRKGGHIGVVAGSHEFLGFPAPYRARILRQDAAESGDGQLGRPWHTSPTPTGSRCRSAPGVVLVLGIVEIW